MARTPPSRTRRDDYLEGLAAIIKDLGESDVPLGDVKIAHGALAEMVQAFKVFSNYRTTRKITAFGSARTQPGAAVFELAERFSRAIADHGFMVITGAGPGIMEAAQRGAGRERSFGVNIRLPHEQGANAVILGDVKLINFRYFFTRKLFFLKEADAVVLFPGGFGTHDEGYETLTLLQTGKTRPVPLILLDQPGGTYWKAWRQYVVEHLLRRRMIDEADLALFNVTTDVDEAVNEILRYYHVFHSIRYVGDLLVIRIEQPLAEDALEGLRRDFQDIVASGTIEQRDALPVEQDEPDLINMPRLVLRFDRRNYGRLRTLIDRINDAGF
ncbi:MAG TPA: LOG family protein [Terriglobales bacterium]|nr:LOG family protein [Terriglobales bacterium]